MEAWAQIYVEGWGDVKNCERSEQNFFFDDPPTFFIVPPILGGSDPPKMGDHEKCGGIIHTRILFIFTFLDSIILIYSPTAYSFPSRRHHSKTK